MKLNAKKVRLFMARACMKRPDLAKAIGFTKIALDLYLDVERRLLILLAEWPTHWV